MVKNGNPVDTTRMGHDVSLTRYAISNRHWKVNDVLCIDARNEHPLMKPRLTEQKWKEYGSEQCKQMMARDNFEGRYNYLGPILNQNDDLNYGQLFVKLRKHQPCGRFHSKPHWSTR